MTDIAAILAHALRAGAVATLLLLASAGAALATDGVEAVPAADAALEPVTGGTAEPGPAQIGPAADEGALTVAETGQSAQAAIDPIVRSAPQTDDAVATVERITGSTAPDILPRELPPPVGGLVGGPVGGLVGAPTAGDDRSPAMPVAGARGIAGQDIRDLAPDRGAARERPAAAPAPGSATAAARTTDAGQSSGVTLPPADTHGGDASVASTLLLALTLGLVGSCRTAVVARLVRRPLATVRIPGSRALLPAVPPG